jgi:hypothetical protein
MSISDLCGLKFIGDAEMLQPYTVAAKKSRCGVSVCSQVLAQLATEILSFPALTAVMI